MKTRLTLCVFTSIALIVGIAVYISKKSSPVITVEHVTEEDLAEPVVHNLHQPISPFAKRLADPTHTPIEDVEIIGEMLAYYTLKPSGGLPLGTNQEVTKALTQKRPHEMPYLPRSHPAINRRGELTDRWKTPYFFHALSSQKIEVRSAGADTILYTEDDLVWPKPKMKSPVKPLFEDAINIR